MRANAYDACNRLGKYRMPFAWTAIWLQNITKGRADGGSSAHGDSDSDSTASNSLDRKSSAAALEQLKRARPGGVGGDSSSLTRKGSLERKDKRSSWAGPGPGGGSSATLPAGGSSAEDVQAQLESFPPVTLTVSSFFKQVASELCREGYVYREVPFII